MKRTTLAKWISVVFDSSFLSLWLFPLVGWQAGGIPGVAWALVAFLILTGFPAAYLVVGRRRGWVSDLELSNRSERPRFIAVSLASDLFALAVLWLGGAPRLVWAFALMYACLGATMLVISSFWKISLHMVGVAGFATLLVYTFGPALALSYVALLPVAWARLVRRKHTPAQLVAGAVAGLAITASVLLVVRP
ncbi:MAG: hypothetical protein Q9O62_09235 [Ardenticatenia bacterium]|nr:hypothetical protein [Ardenticatenia bacterium]